MNTGRFFITSLLVAVSALFFASATQTFASTNYGATVRGNVYSNQNVSGIPVSVSCTYKNGTTTIPTTTDQNGLYIVTFNSSQCGKYAPVSATITVNGQTQTDSVLVSAQNTATMDFSCGSISVPEFGLIPGAFATVISTGSFLLLKRKKN